MKQISKQTAVLRKKPQWWISAGHTKLELHNYPSNPNYIKTEWPTFKNSPQELSVSGETMKPITFNSYSVLQTFFQQLILPSNSLFIPIILDFQYLVSTRKVQLKENLRWDAEITNVKTQHTDTYCYSSLKKYCKYCHLLDTSYESWFM